MADVEKIAGLIIIVTLVILLLIAGITISFFMVGREKSNKEIALSEAQLAHEKELRRLENQIGEELLQQFSRELHDSIGSQLTLLRLEIENRKLDNTIVEQEMQVADQYLDETIEQLRLLSRSLSTDYFRENGLIASMELEITRYRQLQRSEIEWTHGYEEGLLDQDQELALFRIFQEGMNNAVRCAQASLIVIRLFANDQLQFSIVDNGVGFSMESVLGSTRASGLLNMQKRAELANFDFSISAVKGKGTTIEVALKRQTGI